jgi:Flp pilus assembly protein TadD
LQTLLRIYEAGSGSIHHFADGSASIWAADGSIWCIKGNALGKQVKHDEAIKAYDEAIRLNPKLAAAWNGKGCALRSLGRFADADAAFAKAKELGYSR